MLTSTEKRCARQLLEHLSQKDLFAVANTVTNKQMVFTKTEDAMTAIVDYSESAAALFRRQKFTKEVLFKYLVKEGISISPSSEKSVYIDAILRHWQQSDSTSTDIVRRESSVKSVPVQQKTTINQTFTQINVHHNLHQQHNTTHYTPGAAMSPLAFQQQITPAATASPYSQQQQITPAAAVSPYAHQQQHQNTTSAVSPFPQPQQPQQAPPQQPPVDENQVFGERFATWFYPMLNNRSSEYGPQHFYEDCRLDLMLNGTPETLISGNAVCKKIASFITDIMIQFNPNVSRDGVKVSKNPYGICVVNVCGTLHKDGKVQGLFEQEFVISRDPNMDNNWRVKSTKLKMTDQVPSSFSEVTLATTGGFR